MTIRTIGGRWALRLLVVFAAVAAASTGAVGADEDGTALAPVEWERPMSVRRAAPATRAAGIRGSRVTYGESTAAAKTTAAPAAGLGGVCTQTGNPLQCQLPDQGLHGGIFGAVSDFVSTFHVIENFRNDDVSTVTITEICWWGFYVDVDTGQDCAGEVPADNFTITFYPNETTCPSAPDLGQPVEFLVAATRAPTGNLIAGDFEEYEYTVALSSDVLAETCYWIGIRNDTSGTPSEGCRWAWSTAPPGDAKSYVQGDVDPVKDYDLAVCLSTTLGDTSQCELPTDPSCLGATGDCSAANGTPGCDDECCCTLVCATLGSCCLTPWTQECADLAMSLGCGGAIPLCQDEVNCQTYSNVDAFTSTTDPRLLSPPLVVADDFTVATDGEITKLCWQGIYDVDIDPSFDNFRVRVYGDLDGFPDPNSVVEVSQGSGLTVDSRFATNLTLGPFPIYQYDATIDLGGGAGIDVLAGTCYWLEISNGIADLGSNWAWEAAHRGPDRTNPDAAPRQGNGRALQDVDSDGYEFTDTIAGIDLAFCVGLELAPDACGFGTLFDTGPHRGVLFNNMTFDGFAWISGDLATPVDHQRWTAQAFTLAGGGAGWALEQLLLEGEPGNMPGVDNEFVNFKIYSRTALDVPPTEADLVRAILGVAFGGFDPDTEEFGVLAENLVLAPGDYWLVFYASNSSGEPQTVASNIAWYTNAQEGINNFCTENMPPPAPVFSGCTPGDPNGEPPGSPAMLRSRLYPDPGFGAYTLPGLEVDTSILHAESEVNLYNAAFRMRGQPACIWDCGGDNDAVVGIVDFLALLGEWDQVGTPCDFDGGGVGIVDFLELLANWGACP